MFLMNKEMPKSCWECFTKLHIENCSCNDTKVQDYKESRHPNCPIVEVLPHGRLIDADALLKTLREVPITDEKIKGTFTKMMCDFATQIIEKSETVIEASTDKETDNE